jgi:hypothetical protein
MQEFMRVEEETATFSHRTGKKAADIGLEGNSLTLAHNGGAGIFVATDGSQARIDSSRLLFEANAAGPIVGPVEDLR